MSRRKEGKYEFKKETVFSNLMKIKNEICRTF